MSINRNWKPLIPILLMLCLAVGCGTSPPSRLYLLDSVGRHTELPVSMNRAGWTTLGIGPVSIPSYLDRQQIVTRLGPNRIDLAQFDKWAEPLEDNLTRILAENLEHLLSEQQLAVLSWRSGLESEAEYRLVLDVLRLDGSLGDRVDLHLRWRLLDRQGQLLQRGRSNSRLAVQAQTYKALTQAMSLLIFRFCQDIAQTVQTTME